MNHHEDTHEPSLNDEFRALMARTLAEGRSLIVAGPQGEGRSTLLQYLMDD